MKLIFLTTYLLAIQFKIDMQFVSIIIIFFNKNHEQVQSAVKTSYHSCMETSLWGLYM